MYCYKCGQKLPAEANFCFKCGLPVSQSAQNIPVDALSTSTAPLPIYPSLTIDASKEKERKLHELASIRQRIGIAHEKLLAIGDYGLYCVNSSGYTRSHYQHSPSKISGPKNYSKYMAISGNNGDTIMYQDFDGTVYYSIAPQLYGSAKEGIFSTEKLISFSPGKNHMVGVTPSGKVIARGDDTSNKCGVSRWENIISVAAGHSITAGLRSDGTVIVTDEHLMPKISTWHDIVAIRTIGYSDLVGLKSDGTVITTLSPSYSIPDIISDWKDIVAISADGFDRLIGIKSDGTVVYTGDYGANTIREWHNIVAVCTSLFITAGLQSDGTLIIVDRTRGGENIVQCQTLFDDIDSLPQKLNDEIAKYQQEKEISLKEYKLQQQQYKAMQQKKLEAEQQRQVRQKHNLCQHCGNPFSGILIKVCKNCGRKKDY